MDKGRMQAGYEAGMMDCWQDVSVCLQVGCNPRTMQSYL